ncbi:MAG: hypothetical protein IJN54_02945 [Lachnospiraceae bacterium]|nr:hypothetical protein [Lachnospiraceae bacterium]
MNVIYGMYDERVGEIELYFNAISELYEHKNEGAQHEYLKDDFLKMLKSNLILMIYNLVESTIMGGILRIYDQLKSEGYSYNDVREEIKKIWFEFKFNEVYDRNAHFNSYRDKAADIINAILEGKTLELNRKATDISGNLDADKIRIICHEHGITYNLSQECRGGIVLKDVKDKRNDLAHGTLSFEECGRNYSLSDLKEIKDETIIFLKGILDGMNAYYSAKKYLKECI